MKFIKPREIEDIRLRRKASRLLKFKYKAPTAVHEGNLPVWYDGVSDLMVAHSLPIYVQPDGTIQFVMPDGERFTKTELIGHFGSMPEVVVIMVRDGKVLKPNARLVHHSKKNRKLPANDLAMLMLMLDFARYMKKPTVIHGPALICPADKMFLH